MRDNSRYRGAVRSGDMEKKWGGGGGVDRPLASLSESKPAWKRPTLRILEIKSTEGGTFFTDEEKPFYSPES